MEALLGFVVNVGEMVEAVPNEQGDGS